MGIRLEKVCPKCGSHLMIREGENGDFLACPKFPACRYTESLTDEKLANLKIRQQGPTYCDKCNHTGLLPFTKNGKTIPHAYLHCECKIEIERQDHFLEIRPEDFDFPLSESFREFTFEQYGRPWERRREIYQPEEQPETAPTSQPWDQRQQNQIDQTRAELRHIKQKLFEITGKSVIW